MSRFDEAGIFKGCLLALGFASIGCNCVYHCVYLGIVFWCLCSLMFLFGCNSVCFFPREGCFFHHLVDE